ncbi:MAG: hypothetical protein EA395_13675 [Phormidium sp. GEM2.Bin31]|nr:hypothetical protein [Phormidium sp. BM_Day4_Bin.17]TVR06879.1 MAG: hypothetical protein EA395_13675 [Phormidium sp. GEM2.Bin31]UCJ14480.1 MAG: hypothetical protein JWS08_17360 [Phormidium sp. PBR-2020]
MVSIRELVQEAIASGYLSLKAENQLRQRLATKYDFEDFQAVLKLQDAAMAGKVRQESRELLEQSS